VVWSSFVLQTWYHDIGTPYLTNSVKVLKGAVFDQIAGNIEFSVRHQVTDCTKHVVVASGDLL